MAVKPVEMIRNGVTKLFKTDKKTFSLGNVDRSKMIINHLDRVTKDAQYTVDEAILGNKKHVFITKHDYSESPLRVTVYRKEKGFEDGKLVFSDLKRVYDTEPIFGDSVKNIFNGKSRYYK